MSAQIAARGARRATADQVVLGAQPVHQVGDVRRVEHAELRRQRERLGVLADDPVRDRVERAPADPLGRGGIAGAPGAMTSSAARRVNVSSRIRLAGMPRERSQVALATSVPVLPVPAPARISSGPPSCTAARR